VQVTPVRNNKAPSNTVILGAFGEGDQPSYKPCKLQTSHYPVDCQDY